MLQVSESGMPTHFAVHRTITPPEAEIFMIMGLASASALRVGLVV